MEDFQGALDGFCGLQGVDFRKARERSRFFIDFRIVFHRAGAQGVKAPVDAVILFRKIRVVADDVELGHFRKLGFGLSEVFLIQKWIFLDSGFRKAVSLPSLFGDFKYQFIVHELSPPPRMRQFHPLS